MKILLNILLLCMPLISLAATSYHGDSVMSPGGYSTAPIVLSGQSASSGNQYTSTSVVEYQTDVCPSGLTSNGNSTYNSAQRTITTTYLGSQIVGTTTGEWMDVDTDCIGYQYQTLSCPTGYTGQIDQTQKISTGTGGLVYGGWTTTTNSCVAAPPPGETRYSVPSNFMRSSSFIQAVLIIWDNAPVGSGFIVDYYGGQPVPPGTYSVTYNGYVYTNGALMDYDASYGFPVSSYQIVRTPVQ